MSLINDALKKAQKQRTGEAPALHSMPSVGGESPQRIARRAKPTGFNTLILRAGIASSVALVLALGAYFAFGRKPEVQPSAPSNQPSVAGSPLASGPQASTPAPQVSGLKSQVSEQPPAAPAPVTFTLKTEPANQKADGGKLKAEGQTLAAAQPSALSPQPSVSVPATTSAQQPTTTSQQPVQVSAPPKPAPKLEPRAIEFIEALKVAGIRASATDPKVLMNDRVYRPGSVVNAEMGLKLAEITANSLTFEDDHGGRYMRTF